MNDFLIIYVVIVLKIKKESSRSCSPLHLSSRINSSRIKIEFLRKIRVILFCFHTILREDTLL